MDLIFKYNWRDDEKKGVAIWESKMLFKILKM